MNAELQADAFSARPQTTAVLTPIDWLDTLPPEADCLRDYQAAQVEKIPEAMRAGYRQILVQLPTGGGKCLGRGTPVLMADGTVKPVEQILVGDFLIGPDSKPRRVLSLARGREAMYRVTPVKGDSYIVNESHILSLQMTREFQGQADRIINISVRDYLQQSSTFRHCAKGWRSAVEWAWQAVPLDPYFLGVWLGDGDIARAAVSKPDEEVLQAVEAVAAEHGAPSVRSFAGTCPAVRIGGGKRGNPNAVYAKLRKLGVTQQKHIPLVYRRNSRLIRLQVLAGLMDTDGHLTVGGFDFVSASEQLANDTAYLARSLGLAAYVSACRKGCQTGAVGNYWRVSISGDCSVIPTRIARKRAPVRRQKKRVLVHGIRVEPIGEGDYYGFTLDSDGLFLLGDFTVTHNTHEIAAVVAAAVRAGLPVLIIATRTRLVRQLHERLKAFGIRHGVIASSLPELRDYSALVQIASADTLHRRAIVGSKIPLPPAGVVIFDEAHLATAETRLNLLDSYPDAIRIGFTATPARKSGKSLGAAFQCLIPGPSIRQLTALGTLVPLRIFNTPLVTTKELKALPKDNDNDYQAGALSERFNRPKLVGGVLENWLRIAKGKRTLVFAVDKAHGASLLEAFLRSGIAAEMLTDSDDEATREEVVGRLDRGETQVVVNCFLMSYGVDIPAVECIVLARPTRSLTMYLQMVGRGLRPSPDTGKVDCLLIDHGHVVENLGLPQSDFGWTLDSSRNVNKEALDRAARTSATEQTRTCKACTAIWLTSEQGNGCPECGWKPEPKSRAIAVQDADLEEMAETVGPVSPDDSRVIHFFQEALGWSQKRNPQKWNERPNTVRAACWHATREKFKLSQERVPYHYWQLIAMPACDEVSGYMLSRDIRWRYSKRRVA